MSKCRTVVLLIKIETNVSGSSWKGRDSLLAELVGLLWAVGRIICGHWVYILQRLQRSLEALGGGEGLAAPPKNSSPRSWHWSRISTLRAPEVHSQCEFLGYAVVAGLPTATMRFYENADQLMQSVAASDSNYRK